MAKKPLDFVLDSVEWRPINHEQTFAEDAVYATHEGTLNLGGMDLKVYVLNNGMRVFDVNSVAEALGLPLSTFVERPLKELLEEEQ